jgi:hypothetical protein
VWDGFPFFKGKNPRYVDFDSNQPTYSGIFVLTPEPSGCLSALEDRKKGGFAAQGKRIKIEVCKF